MEREEVCYTGEADGKFTGPIAKWAKVGDFFTSLARWTIGDPVKLPRNMMLTQRMAGGICRIELHLDPEREKEPFTGTPTVSILRGESGSTPLTSTPLRDEVSKNFPSSSSSWKFRPVQLLDTWPVRIIWS